MSLHQTPGAKIAIIGGGPAGLRAAEVAAGAGAEVTLFEAKRSVGRKFLVAGRGGLNLTREEPFDAFVARYTGGSGFASRFWRPILADFDTAALRAWAAGLGVETFAASTGRVYPREMKAAPLLRRAVERLRKRGVRFLTGHRWTGIAAGAGIVLEFATEDGVVRFPAEAAVLALGGGSWPDTGSDGGWIAPLERLGIAVSPLEPANCGWETPWPAEFLAEAEGKPLKNIAVRCGEAWAWRVGELMVTRYGLEGGALYQIGAALRAAAAGGEGAVLEIDLKPGVSAEALRTRLGPARTGLLAEARVRWRLGEAAFALLSLRERSQPFVSGAELAAEAKALRLPLSRPRPIAEAISSAGGVRWGELTEALMLRRLPGVFVAGEMIDWEAPTGGYLLQGCFATGTRAGRGAVEFARSGGAA